MKTFLINVTCIFFQYFGVQKVHARMIILSVDARLYILNCSAGVHVFGKKIHIHVLRKGQFCFSLHYAALNTSKH